MSSTSTKNKSLESKNKLEKWKKQLIDFSKRNQLLYFKPRSTLSIEFKDDNKDIFRRLVFENKNLSFLHEIEKIALVESEDLIPLDPDEIEPGMTFEEAIADENADIISNLEELDIENSLQSKKDARTLDQALSKLRLRSQASLQEQGVNILYLALYFVEWSDINAETNEVIKSKSPLFLIPANLSRKGLNGAFRLSAIEDEIRLNPTLAYKLSRDYEIDLNSYEEKINNIETIEELEGIITEIEANISKSQTGWKLDAESCLSVFSFAKLSLYRDLEDNEEAIINHPIIRQIAGENIEEEDIELIHACEIDSKTKANDSKLILDADSSQEEAVLAAKAGASFVIQGPPGTGKSQTIANIIAQALSRNQKVLFVSEKQAALDVVVNRLKESRLDRFCFALHNSQSKKADVIESLKMSLEDIKILALENQRENHIADLDSLKQKLSLPTQELHKIRKPINKSLYEIYGKLSELSQITNIEFIINNIEKIDLAKLSELEHIFKRLSKHQNIIQNNQSYIWRNAEVNNLSFEFENYLKTNLIEFSNLTQNLRNIADPISKRYFEKSISTIREFKWLAEAAKLALESPFPKQEWFNDNKIDELQSLTLEAKIRHEEITQDKNEILSRYSEAFLEISHKELLSKFNKKIKSYFRFFDLDYWKSIGQIKKLSLVKEANSIEQLIEDLTKAAQIDKANYELNKDSNHYALVLGDFYNEFDTNWQETLTALEWVKKVSSKFDSGKAPNSLIQAISAERGEIEFEDFKENCQNLLKSYQALKFHLDFYKSIFPMPNIDIDCISFEHLTIHLDELVNSVAEIENWLDFREIKQEADAIGIGQFIDVLIQKNISDLNENQLKNIFHKKLFQLWADKIELENPLLRKFSGQEQEINIARFIENDLKKIKENQLGISKSIALNWIEYASNPFNKEPLQVLNHEINKKKKHKPIRVLIKEIPDLLMTLKPCWMMSPLSVSQLIESGGKIAFDLVIFDEASQIRTEDAICAIYRGSQLILAGDSNQLPPTNFFNYINDDDDYENNNFESVLDECNVFLDSHTLSWHYRSRHEDLIKFSNKYIYDNQLVTFPSPISKSENLGLQFEYIEKGYYEKGSRFNRKEAQRVAEAIVEHYSKYPEFSLGVIAFSEAQQFAIERELAKLIRNNENINQYLDEDKKDHLFVKNLENVQGDERDVIYFSIGYAKDKQGNLSHNFGPLNREGGHRRLNVAITRARNKIKVFSSIYSGEIDLNRTSAQGAILLKKYLAFVENPSLDSSSSEQIQDKLSEVDHLFINQADSFLIEKSIQKALQDKGFETCLLLGASSFKIDVAVKSKDNPEIFALAIETDGIDYLKANTVRDRDRLRPNVLKSLGWKIHQVWARDWIRNQEQELEKILQSINESI